MERDNLAVVIVGGGQAAARAAKAIRDHGFQGKITLIGDEVDPPYERPPLSKALLLDASTPDPTLLSAETARDLGIDLILGRRVSAIDRVARIVRLEDGAEYPYGRLLLATGSSLRRLALKGAPPSVFYLRSLNDARALEKRLVAGLKLIVVGGGFIGLEVAASAAARGCKVTVVEASTRLLPRLGSAEASDLVLRYHRAHGIQIRLGCEIESADGQGLVLRGGERVEADLIVAGVGVTPNTALAEAAGLEVDNEIVTDASGRTSDPHIYAAGDVAQQYNQFLGRRLRFESWQSANQQAEAAACAIMGVEEPEPEVPWVWSDQGDLNLQVAGAPLTIDHVVLRGEDVETDGVSVFQFADGRLVGGLTLNRGKEMPLIRRMLAPGGAAPDPGMLADVTIPLRKAISEAAA